jgi:hypothetical protein
VAGLKTLRPKIWLVGTLRSEAPMAPPFGLHWAAAVLRRADVSTMGARFSLVRVVWDGWQAPVGPRLPAGSLSFTSCRLPVQAVKARGRESGSARAERRAVNGPERLDE